MVEISTDSKSSGCYFQGKSFSFGQRLKWKEITEEAEDTDFASDEFGVPQGKWKAFGSWGRQRDGCKHFPKHIKSLDLGAQLVRSRITLLLSLSSLSSIS